MSKKETESVKWAAIKVALAVEKLHAEIRAAKKDGQSLRAIADDAQMSYETVRRICEQP